MNESKISPKNKKELQKILSLLQPYTSRVYLVGGAVRDILRKEKISDFDIEVYGISSTLFESLMEKLGAVGAGKVYFVYKYKNFDIALGRVEKKVGIGHKSFEVSICNDERVGASRRDFTMNALMLNLFNNELLNFFDGVNAIENKIIKVVDKERFGEDSLRVLRAIGFSSRFGYKIECEDLKLLNNIELCDISKERIFAEFEKMFESNYKHYGFFYLNKLDVLNKLFNINNKIKLVALMRKFKQVSELSKYHYLYLLADNIGVKFQLFIEQFVMPRDYKMMYKYQIELPKKIDKIFLLNLALNIPIKNWLGKDFEETILLAESLNIYHNTLDISHIKQSVLSEGYIGREISQQIDKRVNEYINNY